jgi:chromatin structure-remodeling complex protein RSC7
VFEKVGSGRGGFSVKGAAAAAARARWAKVRQQKLDAGEVSEEDRPKRRPAASAARNQRRRNDDELPERE